MTDTDKDQVPEEAQQELKKALDTALTKPQQAQGFLTNIPDVSETGSKLVGILDKVIDVVEQVLEYKWLIPDQYEAPLEKFLEALNKVKGWLPT